MVKMIIALPNRVDAEKFSDLVKDVLKGRYGANSMYNGIWLYFSPIVFPVDTSARFNKGFCGKCNISYYEIDAECVDPDIIATIEDLMKFISDADFSFVYGKRILPRDWWRPSYKNFRTWEGKPYYREDSEIQDEYAAKLDWLNETYEKYV